MIPAWAKYTAEPNINASCHLLKRQWQFWTIISSKLGVNVFFLLLHLCNISSGYVFHFVFHLSAESLLPQKSMLCNPTILSAILWDHILGRRRSREQNTGSSAALLPSPSSRCESLPTDLSGTANALKAEHVIKSSPRNRPSVSSCLSSPPLCPCRASVIRQGGHRCSTVAATYWKKSKITALVTCPFFKSAVVFIQRVRALSLSLLTKFLLQLIIFSLSTNLPCLS